MSVPTAKPPRPHLPPLLLAALALWGATALLWPALAGWAPAALVACAALAALAGAAFVAACLCRGSAPVAAIVALGVLAALVASPAAALGLRADMALADGEGGPWLCTLTTDAKPGGFGQRAEARARAADGRVVSVSLSLPDEAAGLLRGQVVAADDPLGKPSPSTAGYCWNAGLAGFLTAGEGRPAGDGPPLVALRRRAVAEVGRYGGGAAPLVQALVCGWRAPIEETGAYDRFKTVGLAHLVAVSGAHLSIVTLFVAKGLALARLGRRATAAATAAFLVGYVAFTGMPVSALRAAVMAAAGLLALVADRRASALNALGLAVAVFVGADPPCALSASFALSAGSTLGIVLLAPLLSQAAAGLPRRARTLVAEPLALTAASSLATQPYAAALFAQVPLLSPLANLVAAPLFTAACVAGFLAVLAACLVPAAAPAAVGAAAAAAAPLLAVVDLLAAVPGSCLPVDAEALPMVALSVAAVGGLWAWWPTVRPRALAALAAAGIAALAAGPALGSLAPAPDEIVMLDVGQGDAFLVRSGGATLLIDTGNEDARLKEACARQGVRALDRVAVSHPDDDHCGSLAALGDVASVGGLLVAEDLPSCPCEACGRLMAVAEEERYPSGVEGLARGDRVRCGRFTLEVVWPDRFADEGGNADSLSFLCSYDGDGDGDAEWTALFCGDAEADELRAMAALLPEEGVDVLKVGHHGSRRSLDAALAARLAPKVALIGVGERNRYGHPAPETVAALKEAGAAVLCSDEAGDVSVAFSMEKLTVGAQRGGIAAQSGTMGP